MTRRLLKTAKTACVLAVFVFLFFYQAPAWRLPQDNYAPVAPVGTVPPAFQRLVKENLLSGAHLSPDGFYTLSSGEEGLTVRKYDYSGQPLAEFRCAAPLHEAQPSVRQIASSPDGGTYLLWSAGPHYDTGLARRIRQYTAVEKYDDTGALAWRYECPEPAPGGPELFVGNGCVYLVGDVQPPVTKTEGVGSPTDFCAVKIAADGEPAQYAAYGGGDYDSFLCAVREGDGFRLHGWTQSKDGDFPASKDGYNVTVSALVDADLKLVSWREETGWADTYQTPEGPALTALPVYGFPYDGIAGTLLCAVRYPECYLTVSNNITGIDYEQMDMFPYRSMIPYFTQTVYTAYGLQDGRLLWRAADGDRAPRDAK